jgi:ubiquitin C-terminal hydrolase
VWTKKSSYVLAVPIPGKGCSLHDCLKEFVKYEIVEGVECSRCAAVPGRHPKQPAKKRLMIGRLPGVLCLRLQRNLYDPRAGYMYKDQTMVSIPAVLDATDACFFSVLAKEEHNPSSGSSTVENSPWKTDLAAGLDVSASSVFLALSGALPLSVMSASKDNPQQSPQKTPLKSRPLARITPNHFEEKNTQYRLVAVIEHIGSAFGGHYVAYRFVEHDNRTFWVRCSDDTIIQVPERSVLESVQAFLCLYERRASQVN